MKDQIFNAFNQIHAEEALIEKTLEGMYTYREKKERRAFFSRRGMALAMSCAMMLCIGVTGWQSYFTPAFLLSVDVNPSIEMSVNRFDRVISTKSYNSEGREVIESVNVKHMNYADAVDCLLEEEKMQGYLEEEGTVLVAVACPKKEKAAQVKETIDIAQAETPQTVAVIQPEKAVFEEAEKLDMSVGKYQAFLDIQEVEPAVTSEEVKEMSVQEIATIMTGDTTTQTGTAITTASSGSSTAKEPAKEPAKETTSETTGSSTSTNTGTHATSSASPNTGSTNTGTHATSGATPNTGTNANTSATPNASTNSSSANSTDKKPVTNTNNGTDSSTDKKPVVDTNKDNASDKKPAGNADKGNADNKPSDKPASNENNTSDKQPADKPAGNEDNTSDKQPADDKEEPVAPTPDSESDSSADAPSTDEILPPTEDALERDTEDTLESEPTENIEDTKVTDATIKLNEMVQHLPDKGFTIKDSIVEKVSALIHSVQK